MARGTTQMEGARESAFGVIISIAAPGGIQSTRMDQVVNGSLSGA
jgi:hypothetical protein